MAIPADKKDRTIAAEIVIDAPRALVWEILVDFARYREWNPFTVEVDTDHVIGNPVGLTVRLYGRERKLTERFDAYDPPRRVGWGMHLAGGRLLRGTRFQELEAISEERTLYRTHERFEGPLAPLVMKLNGPEVLRGFEANAAALKARAEELALKS